MPTAGGKRQVILSKGDKSGSPAFWSSKETGYVLVFDVTENLSGTMSPCFSSATQQRGKEKKIHSTQFRQFS